MDWTKPIDGFEDFQTGRPEIQGGPNCLCATSCHNWIVTRGYLHLPHGKPGDTNHCLIFDDVGFSTVEDIDMIGSGSDVINLYNSHDISVSNCTLSGHLFNGRDNPQKDIGRDICVDGTGPGGCRIKIFQQSARCLTWAAGRGVLGPDFHCDQIQIGGGYGKDVSREKLISVTLIGIPKSKVWVHPKVGRVVWK